MLSQGKKKQALEALAIKSSLNFSAVRLFLPVSGRKLKERKIKKILQLSKHTKCYLWRQRADNPNVKQQNLQGHCNQITANVSVSLFLCFDIRLQSPHVSFMQL